MYLHTNFFSANLATKLTGLCPIKKLKLNGWPIAAALRQWPRSLNTA